MQKLWCLLRADMSSWEKKSKLVPFPIGHIRQRKIRRKGNEVYSTVLYDRRGMCVPEYQALSKRITSDGFYLHPLPDTPPRLLPPSIPSPPSLALFLVSHFNVNSTRCTCEVTSTVMQSVKDISEHEHVYAMCIYMCVLWMSITMYTLSSNEHQKHSPTSNIPKEPRYAKHNI